MENVRVGKVAAVCLRWTGNEAQVLVFEHPLDEGGVMVQLPAGTIEPNESPEVAVVRELHEETGIHAVVTSFVGVRDEESEGESRRRWVYLFDDLSGVQVEWPYTCDCGAPIRCHWLPLQDAEIVEAQQPWLEMAREHFYSNLTNLAPSP